MPGGRRAQAATAGHAHQDEIDLLTVHGILHLLGYDHAEPDEHREMFGLQAQLLDRVAGRDDTPAATDAELSAATAAGR